MIDFMHEKIERWIDETISSHLNERVPCDVLATHFEGFYPLSFLSRSYYAPTDSLPKPDFPELYELGLGSFLEMDAGGITYKNTYFIKSNLVSKLDLHFHELVHVAQRHCLGTHAFIEQQLMNLSRFHMRIRR